MSDAWPVRSIIAGAAGTATLTLAYACERRLRGSRQQPLDYDDSLVPGKIVATVILFPLLGRTPPPWRWPRDVIATSLGTHAAYVAAVAAVDGAARR